MKKALLKLTLIIFSILFTSCLNKTNFTKEDLTWIDAYNENDTLIFQETISLTKDTTIIKKKEVYHSGYQPIAMDNLNPHTFHLWYWNKKYADMESPDAQLIEMYKDKNNVPASPWINYLGFSYDVNSGLLESGNITLSITDKSFSKVYFFEKKKHRLHREEQNNEPQKLYWDKQYGIIKYITYDGEVWERVNYK